MRILVSTGMKPRSSTVTPAASASMARPLGTRPTATSTRSNIREPAPEISTFSPFFWALMLSALLDRSTSS